MPGDLGEIAVKAAGGRAFRELQRQLKAAGAGKLKRRLATNIRRAAQGRVLPALRAAAMNLPDVSPVRRRDQRSIRADIAAACEVSITQNGVKILCNRRKLPKGSEAMPLAFEKGKFRHPVWADPDKTRAEWTWVDQKGKRWFRPTIAIHERDFRQSVRDAVDETFSELGN